jgi:RNA polymerase sigma factor (sigma-70 family)
MIARRTFADEAASLGPLSPDAKALLDAARKEAPDSGAQARVLADLHAKVQSPAIALAREAAAGDARATAELLRQIKPRVGAVVRAVLGAGIADVDDVIQLALIGFVQALPAFRGECDPAGYACRIAARAAVAARRRVRARSATTSSLDETHAPEDTEPSPHESAARTRRTELLRDLLETLPEEQAECLALRAVLGWSLEEVAAASGVPVNTVRSRVRLAKEALRRKIESNPKLADELGL